MIEKNSLLILVILTFIVIIVTDLVFGKRKEKKSFLTVCIRIFGVYGMLIIGTSILSYLITDTLKDQIIVSIILGTTTLSWSLFIETFIKHKYNYLFLSFLSVITTLVFYVILPRFILIIIPVYVLSAILGSIIGSLVKLKVNKGKMVMVAIAMIVFQLGFIVISHDHMESSSKPMLYTINYLSDQGVETDDYYILISEKLYTRYDDVFITCIPQNNDMESIRLIYRMDETKLITKD
ncbi:hypothetical protein EZV73_02350 [Acidaminobacter sp. JC074]|uniref:hypothetical protein n=1 Tax=Acidaminobacter sp. JC074 TaxID=2530199 RepID=UPI001F0D9293|nr:hypothetical protein [Acidaminobacter sp. JC074]MCH4886387.1 hypothetical protein [Acidaminobacter sp. JC074]